MLSLGVATAASALVLTGCVTENTAVPTPTEAGVIPNGEYEVLTTGLDAPWSIVPLEHGALVSLRDEAEIVYVDGGDTTVIGTVPAAAPAGEGGLLGLALLDETASTMGADAGSTESADDGYTAPSESTAGIAGLGDTAEQRGSTESVAIRDTADDVRDAGGAWLYAYVTTETDNRIIRFPVTGLPDAPRLGDSEAVLTDIPKAAVHNGGRLAFGPDGMLYATTGDATGGDIAQDVNALAGKILRMTPEGTVPDDNPFDDSLVYSMGHRNPQGLAWTDDGTLWASEFGQNTWDELNRIEPGGNYGWPVVEGHAGDDRFIDPVLQWSTDEASPSGLAAVGDTLFMAGLGGERLWVVDTRGDPTASAFFTDEFGRIRDVVATASGSLWLLTNNTDGRGNPRADDDRLIDIHLIRAREG